MQPPKTPDQIVVLQNQPRSVSQRVPPDISSSIVDRLIARARKGDAGAQFWTGVAFEEGWCGRADLGRALHWYQLSAGQGDPDAQNALGQMYEDGLGVKQDDALAARWYLKAAEHVPDLGGAGQGRNNLGSLYMQGLGVSRDLVQAYMWFRLAGSNVNLSQAKANMSKAQILPAEQLAETGVRSISQNNRLPCGTRRGPFVSLALC